MKVEKREASRPEYEILVTLTMEEAKILQTMVSGSISGINPARSTFVCSLYRDLLRNDVQSDPDGFTGRFG